MCIENVNRVKEVCEGLIEEKRKKKLDFKLYCEGRVDIINKHPELIDCLKEAGLIRIQIGIESGLDETLNNRLAPVEKLFSIIQNQNTNVKENNKYL